MKLADLRNEDTVWQIAFLSGPNLTGALSSFRDFEGQLTAWATDLGVQVEHRQSNHEGHLLEYIHAASPRVHGFVVNPGGLARVGESFRHALKDAKRPVVEMHFDNASLNEASIFSPTATSIFSGLQEFSCLGAMVSLVLALDDHDFLHPAGTGDTNISHGAPRSLYQ
jgi:3-dehydroquinate dehydratase